VAQLSYIHIYTNTAIRTPPPPLRKIRYIGTSVYDIVSIISLLLLLLFTTIILLLTYIGSGDGGEKNNGQPTAVYLE